jgi:tetrahydromethanopterin:alpha-L-glutamate ligase
MSSSANTSSPADEPGSSRPSLSNGRMRIALFTESRIGLAGELMAALARRGVECVPVSLNDCGFDTTHPHGLRIPGFGDALPDGVLVRSVKSGGFEEVTIRLGVLHALREVGVPVWNDARSIEACVDKSTTTFLIARAGLKTPATFTIQNPDDARAIVARECADGAALVLKPLFGAQGMGLRLVHGLDDLPAPEDVKGVYYLQRFVEPAGETWMDYRLFVCGGRAVAAMVRIGSMWITNIRQGARPEAAAITPELAGTALRAAAAVGANYAGVDLIRDRDGGLNVLEVNSMPAWHGLQEVNPQVSVAQEIVDAFCAHVANSRRPPRLTEAVG